MKMRQSMRYLLVHVIVCMIDIHILALRRLIHPLPPTLGGATLFFVRMRQHEAHLALRRARMGNRALHWRIQGERDFSIDRNCFN